MLENINPTGQNPTGQITHANQLQCRYLQRNMNGRGPSPLSTLSSAANAPRNVVGVQLWPRRAPPSAATTQQLEAEAAASRTLNTSTILQKTSSPFFDPARLSALQELLKELEQSYLPAIEKLSNYLKPVNWIGPKHALVPQIGGFAKTLRQLPTSLQHRLIVGANQTSPIKRSEVVCTLTTPAYRNDLDRRINETAIAIQKILANRDESSQFLQLESLDLIVDTRLLQRLQEIKDTWLPQLEELLINIQMNLLEDGWSNYENLPNEICELLFDGLDLEDCLFSEADLEELSYSPDQFEAFQNNIRKQIDRFKSLLKLSHRNDQRRSLDKWGLSG